MHGQRYTIFLFAPLLRLFCFPPVVRSAPVRGACFFAGSGGVSVFLRSGKRRFSSPLADFRLRLAAFRRRLDGFCCRGYGLLACCRDMYTKKKNRTLALGGRGAHFYVSLTTNLSRAAAERGFRSAEMYFVATGIGPGATGILGVFPACTPWRRYMYISGARKSLIVNTAKERVRTACISSLFSTQR